MVETRGDKRKREVVAMVENNLSASENRAPVPPAPLKPTPLELTEEQKRSAKFVKIVGDDKYSNFAERGYSTADQYKCDGCPGDAFATVIYKIPLGNEDIRSRGGRQRQARNVTQDTREVRFCALCATHHLGGRAQNDGVQNPGQYSFTPTWRTFTDTRGKTITLYTIGSATHLEEKIKEAQLKITFVDTGDNAEFISQWNEVTQDRRLFVDELESVGVYTSGDNWRVTKDILNSSPIIGGYLNDSANNGFNITTGYVMYYLGGGILYWHHDKGESYFGDWRDVLSIGANNKWMIIQDRETGLWAAWYCEHGTVVSMSAEMGGANSEARHNQHQVVSDGPGGVTLATEKVRIT